MGWPCRLALLAACALLLAAAPARAVTVFRKGSDKPIVGFLEHQDQWRVVLRQPLPDGTTRRIEIPRSEIEDLLIPVSPERLAGLRPDRPGEYRDYAEELAEKRRDPEAAAMSRKLYLIAAYLGPDHLGRSCMLALASLADDARQRRTFRAMAYLLDPKHDRSVLETPSAVARSAAPDDKGRKALLHALQSFRRGERSRAMTIAKQPLVRRTLAQFADVLPYEEFTDPVQNRTDGVLRKVLVLELLLTHPEGSSDRRAGASAPSWAHIVQRDGADPAPSLRLETLTGFDPRNCVYRDGKWVRP